MWQPPRQTVKRDDDGGSDREEKVCKGKEGAAKKVDKESGHIGLSAVFQWYSPVRQTLCA